VKRRLDTREQGLSFTEFCYQLLQAIDFAHLYRTRGCRLQGGGSDQWGNIVAGIDLVRRATGAQTFGLVWPLMEGSDGNHLEGNSVLASGDHGILVSEAQGNVLVSNTAWNMSDSGITLESANDGVVRGNDVGFNSGGLQLDEHVAEEGLHLPRLASADGLQGERRDPLLQHRDRRVGDARIHVARALHVEERSRVLGIAEDVRGGLVDRHRAAAGRRVGRLAGVQRQRLEIGVLGPSHANRALTPIF
jgi:parallel beta-helix repeat protein